MPSVYDLVTAGLLDPGMRFIGLDHNDRTAESWRSEIGDALHEFAGEKSSEFEAGKIDEQAWSFISERMDFIRLDFTDDDAYRDLAAKLADAGNILFYLAVAPHFFEPIASGLAKAGLLAEKDGAFRRLVIEKPFGNDLESARRLNAHLTEIAGEDQLFRIDHFLGKEAVQGIPALRFANRAFGPLFHRDTIASVQITAAETVGVEERGSFYESIGALRDMIPNHLFSLLTLIAMEAPKTYSAGDVRDAKAALLGAIRPITADFAVRGQYAAGTSDGAAVRGYREEDNVDRESRTETYAALTVNIENERWRGVPFYLRTGKRMSAHVTTIVLTLRATDGPLDASGIGPELLVFGIDPQRGFVQRFAAPLRPPGNMGRRSTSRRTSVTKRCSTTRCAATRSSSNATT
jgi:glucose-6-phosphate 1-dehydrogenase